MGINRKSLDFITKTIDNSDIDLDGCRMIELGNQMLKGIGGSAKEHFKSTGVDHVSIDTNGKNGALVIDLQRRIKDQSLVGTFDVLTNFGTTEHVEQQYPCWLNIHNLVKQNGIFIHLVPRTGHWRAHGYHKYTMEFFQNLSNSCGYEIIENFIRKSDYTAKDFICCSMIKKETNEFLSEKHFNKMGILVK